MTLARTVFSAAVCCLLALPSQSADDDRFRPIDVDTTSPELVETVVPLILTN